MPDDLDALDDPTTERPTGRCRSGRLGSPAWCSRPPPGGCRRGRLVSAWRVGARWSGASDRSRDAAPGRSRAGSRRSPSTRSRSSRSNSTRRRRLTSARGRGHPGQRPRRGEVRQTISVLDTDLEALRVALSRNPWIEERVRSGRRTAPGGPRRLPPAGGGRGLDPAKNAGDRRRPPRGRAALGRTSSTGPRACPATSRRESTTPLIEILGVGTGRPDRIGPGLEVRRRRSRRRARAQAARLAEFLADIAGDRTRRRRAHARLRRDLLLPHRKRGPGSSSAIRARTGFSGKSAPGLGSGRRTERRREVGAAWPFRAHGPRAAELRLPTEFLWFSPRTESRGRALRSAREVAQGASAGRDESSGRSPASLSR